MSSNNNIVAPLLIGGGILAAIATAFLASGRMSAEEPVEEPKSAIEESIENVDAALLYVSSLINMAGYSFLELYNNFKNLVLEYAPQLKNTLDTLGNSIQSFIENVLGVIPEAVVTAIRYIIKIPYEFLRDFLGPILKDIGGTIVATIGELIKVAPSQLGKSLFELGTTTANVLGVPIYKSTPETGGRYQIIVPGIPSDVDAMTYAD